MGLQARAGGALRRRRHGPRFGTNLKAPWLLDAFATDSNDTGFGVTVTAATVSELREEARYCELRGWTVALEDSYAEIEESIWADGADQNVQDLAESATPGPAPWPRSRRSFRVLHLFPGFRRKEDVEWWIRIRTLAEGMGLIVDVFSVDVAVDGSMDVTQEKIRLGLLEDVRQGFYHASIKGPPCTTWSRARFNQKKGGPRPLRTRSEPLGRSDILMTESELKKVNLGTQLSNVSLDVFEEIAKVDGVFILEHQQDPGAPSYPSIFDLPRVRSLASQPEVDSIDFEQCQFAMPARKATTILARGVSDGVREEAQAILGQRCNHSKHELTPEGTNPDGTFKTSAAQVYPSELCRAMALVMLKNFAAMEDIGSGPDPAGEVTTPVGLNYTAPAPGRTREERRAGVRVRAPALRFGGGP